MLRQAPINTYVRPASFAGGTCAADARRSRHGRRRTLVGAGVVIKKGTTKGVSTDVSGNFSIRVAEGDVLQIGYVGYRSREITVTAAMTFVEAELESENVIDDVVVVGYGSMRRSDVTGSVVSVSMDALRDISSPSVEGLLQGRAAGLQIMNTSQDPGSGAEVRIRGNSSLNGSNTPLVVVDGFPIGDAGNLSQLNPSDIESIEILKDASSAAIYGSPRRQRRHPHHHAQGARGGRTDVTVNHRTTVGYFTDRLNVWRDPLLMAPIANEELTNAGLPALYTGVTRTEPTIRRSSRIQRASGPVPTGPTSACGRQS